MRLNLALATTLAVWGSSPAAGYLPPRPATYFRRSAFRTHSTPRALASAGVQQLDQLITQMRLAGITNTQQLAKLVADNIKLCSDNSFFMRLAELSDATEDRIEKARLSELATTVARTLQSAVERTDALADSKAMQAQHIIAMLADEDGEFVTPIPPAKLAALRAHVRAELGSLDENFVATVRAFLKKCKDDDLSGMVAVLQKVLQVFASERLLAMSRGLRDDLREAVSALLIADADDWGTTLAAQAQGGGAGVSIEAVAQALREEVAQVVLELPSGSLTQSVVAEYLGEAIKVADQAAARADA
ncbi:hypothetical protein T492DRAFT_1057264 [Pavlovales sp. CCMP2436]|nr:hypothetical protein T492DRAFT_1057264 [Pavlovales sp. CCMP2436]|mmetsp:Transcript_44524/g.110329  ORF Transcript_44524/g.110329 Transcript_44524/m.110329 type:complete len:304 (-) Transcript_44524:195-1106(-)